MLIVYWAVALAVAPQITALLARTVIVVTVIRRSCRHDRGVEIYHCPIRPRGPTDDAVGIVACDTAVT